LQRIRTAVETPFEVALVETERPPLYQRIALQAQHLRQLGLSFSAIADVIHKMSRRIIRKLRQFGYLEPSLEVPVATGHDPLAHELLGYWKSGQLSCPYPVCI
jgi:hypothetical protein